MSNYTADVEAISTVTDTELDDLPGADERVTHLENVILQHDEKITDLVDTVDGITENGTIGSSTVGGTAQPVYLNSGTITACSDTVGTKAQPVFMYNGTITECSSDVGDSDTPVYLDGGVVTACSTSLSEILSEATSGAFPTIELATSGYSGSYAAAFAPSEGTTWWCYGTYARTKSSGNDDSTTVTSTYNGSVSADAVIVKANAEWSLDSFNIMCIRTA